MSSQTQQNQDQVLDCVHPLLSWLDLIIVIMSAFADLEKAVDDLPTSTHLTSDVWCSLGSRESHLRCRRHLQPQLHLRESGLTIFP